jgi:predicted metalloendopeptidase
MADLTGLFVAYRAYHRTLNGKEAPVLDGWTGDQRFFLAFAHMWAGKTRPEAESQQIASDEHPLHKYRVNATLQNMPEFQKAFHCMPGDAMVRPPDRRCRPW